MSIENDISIPKKSLYYYIFNKILLHLSYADDIITYVCNIAKYCK